MADRADPPVPEATPGFLLMTLGRQMRQRVEQELQQHGIGLRHYAAIGHLAGRAGISYSELARRGGITVQSLQATLADLEGMGAVERRTPPGRGRTADLHVTDDGRALLVAARRAVLVVEERMLAPLVPADRAELGRLLAAVMRAPSGPEI